jgi:hypothetical protein
VGKDLLHRHHDRPVLLDNLDQAAVDLEEALGERRSSPAGPDEPGFADATAGTVEGDHGIPGGFETGVYAENNHARGQRAVPVRILSAIILVSESIPQIQCRREPGARYFALPSPQ